MTEEQIAFLAEAIAEEIEQHHDNHMDVDVGIHDLAALAGEEMAKEGVVRDLVDALVSADVELETLACAMGLNRELVLICNKVKAALAKARGEQS